MAHAHKNEKHPLLHSRSDLTKELVDATVASIYTLGSDKLVTWQCLKAHPIWEARIHDRVKGSGCPYCAGRLAIPGENDLLTTNPDLAEQLVDQALAQKLHANSKQSVAWRCGEGHIWNAPACVRTRGSACSYCTNKKVLPGFNDLATTHPKFAKELVDRALAVSLTAGSHKKVAWRCASDHTWSAPVAQRTRRGSYGCAQCSGRLQEISYYDPLTTTHPELIEELADQNLGKSLTTGSGKKVEWRCDLGHTWTARVCVRTAGNGCPYCGNRRVLAGFNDLATLHPRLASELIDMSLATRLSVRSNRKVTWRCSDGHIWEAVVYARTRGSNCPNCATHGFSHTDPAWLYLIHSTERAMLKVGIANSPKKRLSTHRGHGWDLVDLQGPWSQGRTAYDIEQAIIAALKERGAVFANTINGIDPFDGYTESWITASYQATTLESLQDLISVSRCRAA